MASMSKGRPNFSIADDLYFLLLPPLLLVLLVLVLVLVIVLLSEFEFY